MTQQKCALKMNLLLFSFFFSPMLGENTLPVKGQEGECKRDTLCCHLVTITTWNPTTIIINHYQHHIAEIYPPSSTTCDDLRYYIIYCTMIWQEPRSMQRWFDLIKKRERGKQKMSFPLHPLVHHQNHPHTRWTKNREYICIKWIFHSDRSAVPRQNNKCNTFQKTKSKHKINKNQLNHVSRRKHLFNHFITPQHDQYTS